MSATATASPQHFTIRHHHCQEEDIASHTVPLTEGTDDTVVELAELLEKKQHQGLAPKSKKQDEISTYKTQNQRLSFAISEKAIHFAAGGIGGMLGTIATQPLDLLKTRLQSSRKMQSIVEAYKSYRLAMYTASALKNIWTQEGVLGLYRGILPNLAGVVPSRAIYFGVYTNSKNMLNRFFPASISEDGHKYESPISHSLAAVIAGVCVSTLMNPMFVLKTRIYLQQVNKSMPAVSGPIAATATATAGGAAASSPLHVPYKGYLDCVYRMYREEGIKSFYKGLTASWMGIGESVVQFVMYEKIKFWILRRQFEYYSREHPQDALGMSLEQFKETHGFRPATYLTVSAACKLFASALTYPHEVLRTRLREQGNANVGLIQCFNNIMKQEGVRALYGGMSAHLLRVVPNAAIMFASYEIIVREAGKYLRS